MRKVKYPEMGSRIKQARINAGLKQKECLESLGDITIQMLSDWERGYVCPTITYLRKISEFYNVSLDYIILGKPEKVNEIIIRSYKDAIEMICALSSCGLFNLESPNTGIKDLHMTVMKTTNNTIAMFVKELNNLIFAQESMKQELGCLVLSQTLR